MNNLLNGLFRKKVAKGDLLIPPIEIDAKTMRDMTEELREAGHPFKPTEFWEALNRKNVEQINAYGLNNFKRTINQNYYNWIPAGFQDNQMASLVSFWAREPSLSPLNVKMELPRFFESVVTENTFLNRDNADIYRLFVGLLWHYTVKTDTYGLTERLSEPDLGNAIRIEFDGRPISQDLANSIRERNTNCDFFDNRPNRKHVIAELGAGYGRLGHVFLSSTNCKYYIFDIPPALLVSQWYLSNLMGEREVFKFRRFKRFEEVQGEIEKADIGFFTPNQLELFPEGYFDAFISISSLHEMTAAQVQSYKKIISRKVQGTVYLKQWLQSHNPFLEEQLEKEEYMFDANWEIVLDRTDPIQDQFFEIVFRRR
jgi:putative sugar O-methyltransferase